MSGAPADYIDVAERIREFRDRYPDGVLAPADKTSPYVIETVGDKTFVVVVAAAYRTPDDPCPGVGMAWEPFPGPTNFTRDSELQNAETSAWGRAIVAVGAADAKRVASANEVANRNAPPDPATKDQLDRVQALYDQLPAGTTDKTVADLLAYAKQSSSHADATIARLDAMVEATP